MSEAPRGLPASVQTRLVRHAKQNGMDPNFVLARFAAERFLFRLSRSPYADRFVLKGALMMLVWLGETIRPTRDADLLGFGEITEQTVKAIFTEVCRLEVEADGLEFLSDSLRVAPSPCLPSGDSHRREVSRYGRPWRSQQPHAGLLRHPRARAA